MPQARLTTSETTILHELRKAWIHMCKIHAVAKAAGFEVSDIVGLQNPNSYRVSIHTKFEMAGEDS